MHLYTNDILCCVCQEITYFWDHLADQEVQDKLRNFLKHSGSTTEDEAEDEQVVQELTRKRPRPADDLTKCPVCNMSTITSDERMCATCTSRGVAKPPVSVQLSPEHSPKAMQEKGRTTKPAFIEDEAEADGEDPDEVVEPEQEGEFDNFIDDDMEDEWAAMDEVMGGDEQESQARCTGPGHDFEGCKMLIPQHRQYCLSCQQAWNEGVQWPGWD